MDHAIDTDRLEQALGSWPGVRLVGPLSGGHRTTVFAGHRAGERVAVRRSRRSPAALGWECALLMQLHAAGLRVPVPHPAADGRLHVAGVTVTTWIDGDPPASTAGWRAVADVLVRLHQLTAGARQRPGFRAAADLLVARRGGDVRLDRMPPEAVRRCRAAWQPLAGERRSVVHGDPGAGNIRISRAGVGLIDWDEARVDAPLFDLAALPDGACPIPAEQRPAARAALNAWEAANGWLLEPAYARRRLAQIAAYPLPD